jgi:hypothetical protein
MDLEKASSTREESYNDDKNKSSFSDPFRNNQVKYLMLRINPPVIKRR